MTEKKIDLIAQLLAKAESTTPEEAEALMEHAYRLMQKYAIDQAVIDARRAREGKTHEAIIEVELVFEGVYRNDMLELGSAVVFALGQMRVMQLKRDTYTKMWVVGFESDARQAETLIRSLQVQALLALKSWWYGVRDDRPYTYYRESEKRQARREFVRFFGYGAGGRIRDNRATVIEEVGSGTELVLVERGKKVDDYVDAKNLRPNRDKGYRNGYGGAAPGAAAGREANTGERSMTQGRGLPAGR